MRKEGEKQRMQTASSVGGTRSSNSSGWILANLRRGILAHRVDLALFFPNIAYTLYNHRTLRLHGDVTILVGLVKIEPLQVFPPWRR